MATAPAVWWWSPTSTAGYLGHDQLRGTATSTFYFILLIGLGPALRGYSRGSRGVLEDR